MAWFQALIAGAFKSRTVWVNILALAVQVLGHASGVLPPEWAPYITAALAVLNLILRFLTTTPLVPTPGPIPDPAPPAPNEPPILNVIRLLLDALANKLLPAPEVKALAVKALNTSLDEAEAQGNATTAVPISTAQFEAALLAARMGAK